MHCICGFRRLWTLALVVAVSAVALPVSGSTFVAMDLNEIVAESEAAVEGRVVSVESFWNETGQVIVTEATIRVDEKLFGQTRSDRGQLVVRTFGGEVDGYTVEAVGFPKFERGERVVLFVNRPRTPDGKLRVTGYQLGHYRISEEGGEKVAVPALDDGARFVSPSGGRATPPATRPLAELKSDILTAARAQRKGGR